MQWLTGRKAAINQGNRGVAAVLADVSGSMDLNLLLSAFKAVAEAVPTARIFIFADEAAEVSRRTWHLPDVGGCTDMMKGLELVAPIKPGLTIVLSDGLTIRDRDCLDLADRMTGAISTLYFGSDRPFRGTGYDFMQKLARRSGQCREFHGVDASTLVREMLHLVRQQRIHHHDLPVRHIHHGQQSATVSFASTGVRINRR